MEFFEKAIEKDRDYALAYAGLADCYNLLSLYGAISPRKTMPKARAAARKALQIHGVPCRSAHLAAEHLPLP